MERDVEGPTLLFRGVRCGASRQRGRAWEGSWRRDQPRAYGGSDRPLRAVSCAIEALGRGVGANRADGAAPLRKARPPVGGSPYV